MKAFYLFFVHFNLLTIAWLTSDTVEAIIGGHDASKGQFKYMVAVHDNKGYICGGAIIGEVHVLTAAHCIINEKGLFRNEIFSIVAGTIDLNKPDRIKVGVEKIYVPAEYGISTLSGPAIRDTIYSGDLAVLKLREKLKLGKDYPLDKVNLAFDKKFKFVYNRAIVTGFGADSDIGGIKNGLGKAEIYRMHSTRLKFAKTMILHKGSCTSMYPNMISDSHLCAQIEPMNEKIHGGVCSGDNGSPLVIDQNIIVGILFYSRHDCNEKWRAAIYTRVSNFKSFILEAIKDETIATKNIRIAIYRKAIIKMFNNGKSEDLMEVYKFL